MTIEVRPFRKKEVPEVLALMRALAAFEGYADRFAVTQADVIAHGFGPSARFGVLVAVRNDGVAGIAVHYIIPWTYDLKPTLVLKELFVAEGARRLGVGEALFEGLRGEADRIGAARITWTVLPANDAAKHLYHRLGGRPDAAWEHWHLPLI